MATVEKLQCHTGGFNFDNCKRNAYLENHGYAAPQLQKTGTTVAGMVFKDGVILGADTRATMGPIVFDKNTSKLHYLSSNIYAAGAGTSADLDHTSRMISANLELHALNTGRKVPVITAVRMYKQMLFRYMGYIGCALVLAGVDDDGPHVYSIYPHGSSHKNSYVTNGSGMLAAMSVLERRWKPDMTLEEGKELLCDAVSSGASNDYSSGNNIDLCIITKDKTEHIRPYKVFEKKGPIVGNYKFKKGTTAVLTTKTIPVEIETTVKPVTRDEDMDTSS